MPGIKNIIFDLGGVLINLDYNKTTTAFTELGVENFNKLFSQFHSNELFTKLETGKIPEKEFYTAIRNSIPMPVTDEQIAHAWNAMLLDFRTESLVYLEELSSRYKLFLLSNTNSIHFRCFQQIFTKDTGKPLLDVYFNKAWYSHLVGLRKPGKEIYEFVLQDAGIIAGETFFIDDSINNIEAAHEMGIRTHLLLAEERIENIGL